MKHTERNRFVTLMFLNLVMILVIWHGINRVVSNQHSIERDQAVIIDNQCSGLASRGLLCERLPGRGAP